MAWSITIGYLLIAFAFRDAPYIINWLEKIASFVKQWHKLTQADR